MSSCLNSLHNKIIKKGKTEFRAILQILTLLRNQVFVYVFVSGVVTQPVQDPVHCVIFFSVYFYIAHSASGG